MVSRVLSRLRAALPAFALLIFLATLHPVSADAANPYEYTDRDEGDPGDGVLDPAVDGNEGGGSGIKNPDLIANTTGGSSLFSGDFLLVPVYVPTGQPGQGTFIFLPRAWNRAAFAYLMSEGGWPYAP